MPSIGSPKPQIQFTSSDYKTMGVGMTAASGIMSAFGQYFSAKNQIANNNLQADYLLKNAYLNSLAAQKNIDSVSKAGMEQMSAITDDYLDTESNARVAAAVSNVDITKGSALDVANASYMGYLKDKDALSRNIGENISEIETQANLAKLDAEYQAKQLKLQNRYIRRTRWIGIGSTLLGSAAQAAAMMA